MLAVMRRLHAHRLTGVDGYLLYHLLPTIPRNLLSSSITSPPETTMTCRKAIPIHLQVSGGKVGGTGVRVSAT